VGSFLRLFLTALSSVQREVGACRRRLLAAFWRLSDGSFCDGSFWRLLSNGAFAAAAAAAARGCDTQGAVGATGLTNCWRLCLTALSNGSF
jgi:hypothetical protein